MKLKLCLIFFLTSCGLSALKKVIVPNLAYIVADKTGDQLDLYYSQEKKLKKEIKKLFQKKIPEIQKLKSVIQHIDIEKSETQKVVNDLTEIFQINLFEFNIILSDYTAHLTREQQKRFFRIQKDKNEDIQKRIKKKSVKRIIEHYEYFFGSLSKEQLELIKANEKVYLSLLEYRLERRLKVQKELLEIFKIAEKTKAKEKILILYNQSSKDGQSSPMRQQSVEVLKKIVKSLSQKQKKNFNESRDDILEWVDEFIRVYAKVEK